MLRDHFHPPLTDSHHWESFYLSWATTLSADLNRQLPDAWFSEPKMRFRSDFDEQLWQGRESLKSPDRTMADEWNAVAREWEIPAVNTTIRFPLINDFVGLQVFDAVNFRDLVGEPLLVLPATKSCADKRGAFNAKCEAKLREGIGLIVIDPVTTQDADLHQQLLERIGMACRDSSHSLYVAAYHPTLRDDHTMLDVFHQPIAVGEPLPRMPLFLKNGPCLQVDLPATYETARTGLRIL